MQINTGLDRFILIDKISEAGTGKISGTKNFSDAPIYLGIESLAQLGAYHVRFLTDFESHAFLSKITNCLIPAQQVLNGEYSLCGTLLGRSASAFSYFLEAKKAGKTRIKGKFLFATVSYDRNFRREILQNHYRTIFSCLKNDLKADCLSSIRPGCTEIPQR